MATDIHAYLERRVDGMWRLTHDTQRDEEGWLDVPPAQQPLRGMRSSTLFALMHGNPRTRLQVVYATFQPLPGADRQIPDDLSVELAQIWEGWRDYAFGAGTLTPTDLRRFPWQNHFLVVAPQPDPLSDRPEQLQLVCYEDWGAPLLGLVSTMQRMGPPQDVRMVYWFDC